VRCGGQRAGQRAQRSLIRQIKRKLACAHGVCGEVEKLGLLCARGPDVNHGSPARPRNAAGLTLRRPRAAVERRADSTVHARQRVVDVARLLKVHQREACRLDQRGAQQLLQHRAYGVRVAVPRRLGARYAAHKLGHAAAVDHPVLDVIAGPPLDICSEGGATVSTWGRQRGDVRGPRAYHQKEMALGLPADPPACSFRARRCP
jgi:hypothetical protein